MLSLHLKDIHLNARATDKRDAIVQVAAALKAAGCVGEGYVEGMLAREQQTSTYLGNGIAIPHGTTQTRDQVLQTGVQVFQFPQGICWGEGQDAFLVIGIAARSDEHLSLLRQLTHVLSDESLSERLKNLTDAQAVRRLLTGSGDMATEMLFDSTFIQQNIATDDLLTLQALNCGRLHRAGAINRAFMTHAMSAQPLNLGQGIWLSDSPDGNVKNAMAISQPARPFRVNDQRVAMLMTVAMKDNQPQQWLDALSDLLTAQQAEQLLTADAARIITLLTGEAGGAEQQAVTEEFIIRNEHGLHARPGTELVQLIGRFNSKVMLTNLNGSGKPVNGRSLMRVIALGVKKGHRLRVCATGEDAAQAVQAIGQAIKNGLGEVAA